MDQCNVGEDRVNPIQLQKFLKQVDYPATRQELIDAAKKEGADQRVIETLQRLPDREYDGPVGVSKAVGEFE